MLAGAELLQQPRTVFDREKAVAGAFVVAPSVAWFHMDGHAFQSWKLLIKQMLYFMTYFIMCFFNTNFWVHSQM